MAKVNRQPEADCEIHQGNQGDEEDGSHARSVLGSDGFSATTVLHACPPARTHTIKKYRLNELCRF
jgi:hypothetical protein